MEGQNNVVDEASAWLPIFLYSKDNKTPALWKAIACRQLLFLALVVVMRNFTGPGYRLTEHLSVILIFCDQDIEPCTSEQRLHATCGFEDFLRYFKGSPS